LVGSNLKVIVSAILGNLFITIMKFVAWGISLSPSMLAEAIHSAADTLNQILLLIGQKQSKRLASRFHPRGFGSSSYLWNLISAVGIFFIGFGVTFYHGLHSLLSPDHSPSELSYIVLGVLLLSIIIEGYVFLSAYKEIKKHKKGLSYLEYFHETDDPSLLAVLLEDGVAVLGLLLALVGICLGHYFQSPYFDIVAAILISLLLGFMAIALAFLNGKLLIGKSISLIREEELKAFIERLPEVLKIEKFSTLVIGSSQVRLTMEIELNGEYLIDHPALVQDSHKIADGIEVLKVLIRTSERMVRITGNAINSIEAKILKQFPEVSIIDIEIN